jgi:hypothetical protein
VAEADRAGMVKGSDAAGAPRRPVLSATVFVLNAVREKFINAECLVWKGNALIAGIS